MTLVRGLALRGPQLIGLDIGTTAVKAARIRRKGDAVTVVAVARAALDQAGHENAPAGDKTALAIWRCLHILREPDGAVVCGLAGPDIAVRTFDFPALPPKQLHSAVELEAALVCPFDVNESAVAYQVLQGPSAKVRAHLTKEGSTERMTGIFAAAKNSVIGQRRELCERGKAYCMMVDVDGLALLNCLEVCKVRAAGERALVLNAGSAYTNVAIISDDGLPFVRDIPYAAEAILNHISRNTSRPKQAIVEALTGADEAKARDLRPSLNEACSTLADRVLETVRYYGTRGSDPALDRVLLCGGFAQAPAVTDTLASLLGGKVELWNPLATLPCARPVRRNEVFEQGPAFAVALGLAMRSLRDVHD